LENDVGLRVGADPDADYGWAKLTGERLATNARKQGVTVSVVRPFSGYGTTQSSDYPFPSIVARAREGDLSVWGPPGQTRDWIHVDDVTAGAMAVVRFDADSRPNGWCGPVNLCTGIPTEMGKLARMIWKRSLDTIESADGCIVEYDDSKPTGVLYRVGDPHKMLRYYTPKISLEEGIERALKGIGS